MKKTKLFLTIPVILLVFAMTFVGCASMTLVSLERDTIEGPKQVRQGDDIDPASITVWGIYKDDSRKTVRLSASNIVFDKRTPGAQTVRIRVGSQEATFQTEVMALRSLTITSQPTTVLFKAGQDANAAWPGLEIQGEWNQMGTRVIPVASCEIAGYNKDQAGRQTIRVTYYGQTATFNVDVRAMTSIRIATAPTKLDYLQGETLDLTGLSVVGVWEGFPEDTLSITASDITGFNGNNSGSQRLTVTKNGRSATFNVDVWGLVGIVLDKPPNKTDYAVGERLDLTGIVVNANYAGSTAAKRRTEAVPLAQLTTSGFNSSAVARQQRVSVTVRGQTANFFVNIVAAVNPALQNSPLLGTWSDKGTYITTNTYTFNSNGTCNYTNATSSGAIGASMTYTWSTSGNTLILELGGSITNYPYSISGNTLTLTYSNGTTGQLTRQ